MNDSTAARKRVGDLIIRRCLDAKGQIGREYWAAAARLDIFSEYRNLRVVQGGLNYLIPSHLRDWFSRDFLSFPLESHDDFSLPGRFTF